MTLKKYVKQPFVRAKFKEEFKKPRIDYRKEILAPPLSSQYGLVGTAFDFLARFYVEYINRDKVFNRQQKWIAEEYIEKSSLELLNPKLYKELKSMISKIRGEHSKFIRTGKMKDVMFEDCIILAKIDNLYRSGYPIDDDFYSVDENSVRDLMNVFDIFTKLNWETKEICFLNPKFNVAQNLVGNADADLILDDRLIDFKTVKAPGMSRESFNQIMGYYLLNEIEGIVGYDKKHTINKIAEYSSRYGELIEVDISDIFDINKLPEIIDWMFNRTVATF